LRIALISGGNRSSVIASVKANELSVEKAVNAKVES
jgi:hypothetical protein